MDEEAALMALYRYEGVIIAIRANAAALLRGEEKNRHFSDRVIRGMVARGGVIGAVPFNNFLLAGWKKGQAPRDLVIIDWLVAQIDYMCQETALMWGLVPILMGATGWKTHWLNLIPLPICKKSRRVFRERLFGSGCCQHHGDELAAAT